VRVSGEIRGEGARNVTFIHGIRHIGHRSPRSVRCLYGYGEQRANGGPGRPGIPPPRRTSWCRPPHLPHASEEILTPATLPSRPTPVSSQLAPPCGHFCELTALDGPEGRRTTLQTHEPCAVPPGSLASRASRRRPQPARVASETPGTARPRPQGLRIAPPVLGRRRAEARRPGRRSTTGRAAARASGSISRG